MKRWTNILGRGGTTLIAISLALLLISLIPQIDLITRGSGATIPPEGVFTTGPQALNPQQGIQLNVTVEGTLKVYLLDMGNKKSNLETDQLFVNATEMQEFLDSNPNSIIWDDELDDDSFDRYYSPTKVINASFVFYNPTTEVANVEYTGVLKSSLAPGEKVRTIAYWTTPIGLVMAIPWLLDILKGRKKKIVQAV